ncbi:MAG: FHA domain-containing protein [bacterium]|nr:FHA domain-containing protein [bacterium]MDD5353851.1 FHA domain-containing protein [bacterium]MDD5757422.1 FHA domain-containing protein [bacterium]
MKIITITVTTGSHKGETFFVADNSSIIIGRGEEAGLCLTDDHRASRKHAIIGLQEGNAYVSDLSSTNGTFIGKNQVHGRVPLKEGDIVFIGRTYFKITIKEQ